MELFEAADALSSLAQETRLRVFKLLVEHGKYGTIPGKIARELKIPGNTLSFHLSHLARAGLVATRKSGRSVNYRARLDRMDQLVAFLRANCCSRSKGGC